jgi:Na+/H+-dicarboxylate symporter
VARLPDRLVPSNILGLAASTKISDTGVATTGLSFNVLQIVVISLVTGVAALKVGEAGEAFLAFNASALAMVRKVLWWVIRLTPIGTIGLFGNAVAQYGWTTWASSAPSPARSTSAWPWCCWSSTRRSWR